MMSTRAWMSSNILKMFLCLSYWRCKFEPICLGLTLCGWKTINHKKPSNKYTFFMVYTFPTLKKYKWQTITDAIFMTILNVLTWTESIFSQQLLICFSWAQFTIFFPVWRLLRAVFSVFSQCRRIILHAPDSSCVSLWQGPPLFLCEHRKKAVFPWDILHMRL